MLEKRLLIPHLQNTVYVSYRRLGGEADAAIQLQLRPLVHFRPHDAAVERPHPGPYRFTAWGDRYEISAGPEIPPLRMTLLGPTSAFTLDAAQTAEILYRLEAQRGYDSIGDQWSPGFFHVDARPPRIRHAGRLGRGWETLLAMPFEEALRAERGAVAADHGRPPVSHPAANPGHRTEADEGEITSRSEATDAGFHAELVLAADQFLITPAGRVEDAARAHAAGDEVRTVIAGYHWFTDWGRDTMISLEGLTLTTGRTAEAGYILRTFAHYVRDGLIPNLFPEGADRGALSHRRRHALVLPRHRPLRRGHRRPRDALSRCCPG